MAPTIAQIMTENTAGQTYRATYSPDDNKLRLYASLRLDEETYSLINKAGFRWAPKQELFVAPAWTPGREDVLLSLAGDIEDEDSTLFDRQEQRAGRFSDYSDRRAVESEQALAHVDSLASAVPLGQPILVGHHSERRARRHAQKIENGMKRAVMLFERAEYWEQRAQASLQHAKYKERPDVRYRRIKKIEAELRKSQKHIARSEKYMTMWRAQTLDLNMALLVSNYDHIHACFTLDKYPRPAEKSQNEGSMSLHSALSEHYQNRLAYERAMLNENGGVVTRTEEFEPGGQVLSRGEWLTILRVNQSQGEVSSVETPCYRFLDYSGTMKLTPDRITDYKAPTAEEASDAKKAAKRPPIVNYPGEGFREMTKAEWAKLPADYKVVRGAAETETHGAYRFRRCMTHGCTLVNVYITDMKTVEMPKK
ncbi:Domain of uncharacterised function (DUF3560) [Klebsiella pneumoniae]|uniref:DUF3560 domain-containing protein n=1 Tax=Klebsiella pneumoniae TaxID=573 RepID=UPI0009BC03BE|nr:DUF3560 domain-containing protein [Klebsiella pneumoniae]SLV61893.1 Domain of uncharacterised function (DUF3560) [Klebsiella pneumoniae]